MTRRNSEDIVTLRKRTKDEFGRNQLSKKEGGITWVEKRGEKKKRIAVRQSEKPDRRRIHCFQRGTGGGGTNKNAKEKKRAISKALPKQAEKTGVTQAEKNNGSRGEKKRDLNVWFQDSKAGGEKRSGIGIHQKEIQRMPKGRQRSPKTS